MMQQLLCPSRRLSFVQFLSSRRPFSESHIATTKKVDSVNDPAYHDLFRYTSGRWLCNEEEQLRRRYLDFNVEALKQIAGQIQGSSCATIQKLPEGFNNKVFSVSLENGSKVIARLPTPCVGHPHWVVASEVATLDFLRTKLDIPVPKVLGWSSQTAENNPVGAEYIVMEHAPGRRLSSVWSSMIPEQRFAIIKALIGIEQKLTASSFGKYGAIYFRQHCPTNSGNDIHNMTTDESDYVIGPVADSSFWATGLPADVDAGPWDDTLDYFTAIARREIVQLQKSSCSAVHVELLQSFIAVLPFILPIDKQISRSVLWHLDLHGDNIFIDDEDPTKITRIVDWQNVWAAPLFMQARFPSVADCPWDYPKGAVMPTLPGNFDSLVEEEKILEEQKLREIKLKKYYEIGTRRLNPEIYRAMFFMDDDHDPTAAVLRIFSQTRGDGQVPLQELLIQIYEKWDNIVGRNGHVCPCPISFSGSEILSARRRANAWAKAYTDYESLRSDLLGKDGWASHEEYAEANRRFEMRKHELYRLKKKLEDVARTCSGEGKKTISL